MLTRTTRIHWSYYDLQRFYKDFTGILFGFYFTLVSACCHVRLARGAAVAWPTPPTDAHHGVGAVPRGHRGRGRGAGPRVLGALPERGAGQAAPVCG